MKKRRCPGKVCTGDRRLETTEIFEERFAVGSPRRLFPAARWLPEVAWQTGSILTRPETHSTPRHPFWDWVKEISLPRHPAAKTSHLQRLLRYSSRISRHGAV